MSSAVVTTASRPAAVAEFDQINRDVAGLQPGSLVDLVQVREGLQQMVRRVDDQLNHGRHTVSVDDLGRIVWTGDMPSPVVLSDVTTETFAASDEIDLNQLRTEVLSQQRRKSTENTGISVTSEGRIVNTEDGGARVLSDLTTETFAASPNALWDNYTTSRSMPSNTRSVQVGDRQGWTYSVVNEFDDCYQFFAYWSDNNRDYRVMLISPNLEGQYGSHQAHLYTNGLCCLTPTIGTSSLELAFTRSVLWCNGVSVVRRGGTFPFTIDQ